VEGIDVIELCDFRFGDCLCRVAIDRSCLVERLAVERRWWMNFCRGVTGCAVPVTSQSHDNCRRYVELLLLPISFAVATSIAPVRNWLILLILVFLPGHNGPFSPTANNVAQHTGVHTPRNVVMLVVARHEYV